MNLKKPIIIMAEDDEDDCLLIKDALEEAGVDVPVICAGNGEELINILVDHRKNSENYDSEKPAFILLDLNMPKMDGRKSLDIIGKDADLKKIPIIVFTTSNADEDISLAYARGANSYILKPHSFNTMVDIMKTLKSYWLEIVSLPA